MDLFGPFAENKMVKQGSVLHNHFYVTESQIENYGNFKLKIMGVLYFCREILIKNSSKQQKP